ncbi:MAG: tRNA (guanosine(46)-N7)-methyltransferase TrmB [Arenicellales bacterium]
MPLTSDERPPRFIKSFVRREGRITRAQERALEAYWDEFGLQAQEGFLDWERVFGRRAPVVCEIGFGDGRTLLEMARQDPARDFVGVEVYRPGVGALLLRLKECGVGNVRVALADAAEFLRDEVPPASLDELLILFPDPWPKRRHHKRRLIQPPFVEMAASRLVPGGRIHCATDWEDYAAQMMEVLSACGMLRNVAGPNRFAQSSCRTRTKYEDRGEKLGHRTWDLIFERTV